MTEMERVPVGGKKRRRNAAEPVADDSDFLRPPVRCSCPILEADEWHEVESDWSDIAFLKGSVSAMLGVPVGYADVRESLMARARRIGAVVPEEPMVLLGSGRFRRRLLLEIEGAKPGARGVVLPGGISFSRLLEVPWGEMKRAVAATSEIARARYGRKPDDVFVWYLTCRVCSRERNFETLIIAHYRKAP